MIIRKCKHDKRQGKKDFGKLARVAALPRESVLPTKPL